MVDDRYDMRMPFPTNALDIFAGQWSGEIPTFNRGTLSKFYEDHRILFFEKHIAGFSGKKILELGPLEASHTYMMSVRGASDILCVEANRNSYLKCLIVKELLSINARFLLGDFCLLLRDNPPRVDVIIASGVLYHMTDPLGLIEGMVRASDTICIWTHYFDADIIRRRPELSDKFAQQTLKVNFYDREITMCEQSYLESVEWGGFCGGAESKSYWLTRDGIFAAFEALGYDIVVGDEALDHPNGPCLTFVARRKGSKRMKVSGRD
jgi:hypothetical protein